MGDNDGLSPLLAAEPVPVSELGSAWEPIPAVLAAAALAAALLERIEADAGARGIRELVLETGPLSEPALALYRRHGYREIPLFGQYVGELFSVCFAKSL